MTSSESKLTVTKPAASFDATVQSLSRTCAFPEHTTIVEVRQTHISAVFLGGDIVYKLKKPVKLPFLDFSNATLRHHFCDEEVRINRPWAPGIYLSDVPVTTQDGGFQSEGDGPIVEWAVKMQRLPESVTLRSRLHSGSVMASDFERVARRIAMIHRSSVRVEGDKAAKAVDTFRRQFNDNWTSADQLAEEVIDRRVLERLKSLATEWLDRFDALLRTRAENGWIREVYQLLDLVSLQPKIAYQPRDSIPDPGGAICHEQDPTRAADLQANEICLQHFEQTVARSQSAIDDRSKIVGHTTMLINRVDDEQTRFTPFRRKLLSTFLRATLRGFSQPHSATVQADNNAAISDVPVDLHAASLSQRGQFFADQPAHLPDLVRSHINTSSREHFGRFVIRSRKC